MKKKLLTLAAVASIALLSGCASVPNDSGQESCGSLGVV